MDNDIELDEFFDDVIEARPLESELLAYLSGELDEFVRSRLDAHFRRNADSVRRLNSLQKALEQPAPQAATAEPLDDAERDRLLACVRARSEPTALRGGALRRLLSARGATDPELLATLTGIAADETEPLRKRAIRALGTYATVGGDAGPTARDILTQVATAETSGTVELRATAVRALAEFKDDGTRTLLSDLAQASDAHWRVRAASVAGLGRVAGAAVTAPLQELANNPDEPAGVRVAAWETLSRQRPVLLLFPSVQVREGAAAAAAAKASEPGQVDGQIGPFEFEIRWRHDAEGPKVILWVKTRNPGFFGIPVRIRLADALDLEVITERRSVSGGEIAEIVQTITGEQARRLIAAMQSSPEPDPALEWLGE